MQTSSNSSVYLFDYFWNNLIKSIFKQYIRLCINTCGSGDLPSAMCLKIHMLVLQNIVVIVKFAFPSNPSTWY